MLAGDSGGGRRPCHGSLKPVLTVPASVDPRLVRNASPCFHRGEMCPVRGLDDGEGGKGGKRGSVSSELNHFLQYCLRMMRVW